MIIQRHNYYDDDYYYPGACDDGWRAYYEQCYKYFATGVSFAAAKENCAKESALLVKVETEGVDEFVYNLVSETK
jgi:hypothetical protein